VLKKQATGIADTKDGSQAGKKPQVTRVTHLRGVPIAPARGAMLALLLDQHHRLK
jgi:hypothetical protein